MRHLRIDRWKLYSLLGHLVYGQTAILSLAFEFHVDVLFLGNIRGSLCSCVEGKVCLFPLHVCWVSAENWREAVPTAS